MPKTISPPTEDDIAAQLQQWKCQLDPEIDYDLESMFPQIRGWGVKNQIKQKVKLINRVEPLLSHILLEGEEVLFVSKGMQHSLLEQYFMGIIAIFVNQTVFVVTTARLLMFRSNTKGKPKEPHWQMYYSQVDDVKSKWTGVLHLKLSDGKKLTFAGFPRADRKQMVTLFEEMVEKYEEHGFDPDVTQSRENLCGDCHVAVPKDEFVCHECGTEFWTPASVALRSLVIPAWGDWIMGHRFLALWEFTGVLFGWTLAIVIMALAIRDNEPLTGILFAIFIVGASHVSDAIFTYVNARKGLHTKSGPDGERAAEAKREYEAELVGG